MSSRTRKNLIKVADGLERIARGIVLGILNCVELILIDAVYGKAKYRKRPSQRRTPRPIIHKTVIIKQGQ